MVDTRILLAFIWVAVMLVYLLGDVLRLFSGDAEKADTITEIKKLGQWGWLGISVLMMTPIVFMLLSLMLDQPAAKAVNIVGAVFWLIFNAIGLPTYPSYYDRFLLIVSMVFNVITLWYVFNWV